MCNYTFIYVCRYHWYCHRSQITISIGTFIKEQASSSPVPNISYRSIRCAICARRNLRLARLHAFLKTKSNRYTLCSPNIIRKYDRPKVIWFTVPLPLKEKGICKTNGAYLSEIENIHIVDQFFYFYFFVPCA